MTNHSGVAPTSRAAMPEGMRCSAHTTPPLPPSSRKRPITAADFQFARVGAGSPLHRRQAYRTTPEIRKRAEAIRKGGMLSIAKRMPR